MRLNRKPLSHLFVPWLLAFGSACQGTSPSASPPPASVWPVGSPTPARPITAPVTAAPTRAGTTGLAGQVLAASDVSGQPDAPLADQLVLAVAADRADQVLGPGTAGLEDAELRFLKADLPAPHPALAVTLSDAAGNYALTLAPGAYLLCLADSDATPPGFPARTRGCGRVELAAGAVRRVDVSSGFGEILLVAP